jgi:hypothetical protein
MTISIKRADLFFNRLTKKSLLVVLIMATLLLLGCGNAEEANKGASTSSPAVANNANPTKSAEGSIKADPNPVPAAGDERGKTKISWTTKPDVGVVNVFVVDNGQPEFLFASNPEGSVEAPWIVAGGTYEFRLYAGSGSNRRLIDKVVVTR